jgi:hypothetical protein
LSARISKMVGGRQDHSSQKKRPKDRH